MNKRENGRNPSESLQSFGKKRRLKEKASNAKLIHS